ncbi:MAG: MIP/aquaporin family protein [Blastocatellales bacterium]
MPNFNPYLNHIPEYLIEAAGLGLFMVSACSFGILLEHPGSAVHQAIPSAVARRVLMGMAMGLTAIAIIYSPWGKRSGAHINPSVTLTYFRLGKIEKRDFAGYLGGQFIGAACGVLIASLLYRSLLEHPSVHYVATLPGRFGDPAAFGGEMLISFLLMTVVLIVSNDLRLSRYTGLFAGAMVMAWITLEAPVSGMSMNPARTFGSALAAGDWRSIWIYFAAPPAGMLLAAEIYLRRKGAHQVLCAKLNHHNNQRCIFRCNFDEGSRITTAA